MTLEVQPSILHPDFFVSPCDKMPLRYLESHVAITQETIHHDLHELSDGITVAVQMYDHTAPQLERLVEDIAAQDYSGDVQLLFLDAGSDPNAQAVAAERGTHVPLRRKSPSLRADFLNKAVEMTDHDTIFTTVGHAALSNTMQLAQAATYGKERVPAYGAILPHGNASYWERALAARSASRLRDGVLANPAVIARGDMRMTSDCSVISRAVVNGLEGYNKKYGLGGADNEMADRLAHAGHTIYFDAALSVHSSKGFGLGKMAAQIALRKKMAKPRPFVPFVFNVYGLPHGGL